MKQLNFLSKSSSQSCGHSSVTLASTVGSPSAHRRGTMLKHVAFLLLFLFAGFGNVWGGTFTKITSLSDLTTGDYVIVGQKGSSNYGRLTYGTLNSSRIPYSNHYTSLPASSITTTTANEIWHLEVSGTGTTRTVTIYNSGQKKYLNPGISWGNSGTGWTVSYSSGFVFKKSDADQYLGVNSSANYWKNYASSTVYSTSATLYKAPSEYTITATRNNNSYGNVSVSGNTITATPSTGYRVKAGNAGYTVSSGTATVTNNGDNTFTVTPTSNCTICINFEAIPTHTVTWSANSTTTSETYQEGATITFPTTATGCNGGTFMGWASATISGTQATAPTYVSSANMGNNNITYYAVFATASDDVEEETDTERGSTTNPYVANTGWSASAGGTYTTSGNYGNSSPSIKMSTNGDYVQSPTYSGAITAISYWYKPQNATGSISTFVSTNGSTWTELTQEAVSFSSSSTSGTKSITVSSNSGYKAVKIVYNKTTSNVAIDDIAITYEEVQYSDYRTSCCEPLGSINGSVSLTQSGNSVTIKNWGYTPTTAGDESHISKYTVYLYDAASPASPIGDGIDCTVANRASTGVTFSNLDYSKTYKVKISATPASGYCAVADAWLSAIGGNAATTFQLACEDAELAYGTSPVAKTFGDAKFTNALNNSHSVAVTYASNAPGVATVDENGEVTILGAGSATITASSIQQTVSSVKYCADEASYILNVSKADITPALSYDETSLTAGDVSSDPSITGNTGSGTVTYAVTAANPAGCVTVNANTGVVEAVAAGEATITATIAATANYKGNTATANFTIAAASNFLNGKTIFIQAESTSAWTGGGCVKAWFHSAGGSEEAQSTYWLFDATDGDAGKKLFAAIVPASGNMPYLDIQRFAANCNDWWNKNGGCSYADANGSNTIRSYGKHDDGSEGNYVAWNGTGVTLELFGTPNSFTGDELATFADQGAGVWTATYENYAPAATSADFKIKTNYNGWIGNKVDDDHQNENATLDGMKVGSTYNVTATLDITDHSLTMSKTFVKGTVSFNLQGHGDAIDALTNVAAGSKISAPNAPSATGYDFGGWFTDQECTEGNEWTFATDAVTESMTLYAKWTVHNYTISTNLTGVSLDEAIASSYPYTGSAANIERTLSANTGYLLPATISVTMGGEALTAGEDYTYSEGAFALSVVITGDIEISAEGIRVYTVTFDKGTGVCETSSLTQASAGANIQLPEASASDDCTEESWSFAGWSATNVDSETTTAPTLLAANSNYQPNNDVTLYAVYQRTEAGSGTTEETASVSISDYATAHSWASESAYSSVTIDENITATASSGGNNGKYYTTGNNWRFYRGDNGTLTITAAANCTLASATITFAVEKYGTLNGEGEDGEVTSGTAFAISGSSYEFTVGGGETGKTNGQVRITAISVTYNKPNGPTTYYVSEPSCAVRYTITVDNEIANGSVSVSPNVAKATEGTQLTLTATPAGGYHFEAWNVYKTDDAETTVTVTNNQFNMPDHNVTLSATFEHDPCDNLVAPTKDNENFVISYNSATIAWNTVSGATGGYAVSVVKHGEAEPVFSGNVNALSKALADLEPETQYDYSIMAIGDGTEKCTDGNGVLEDNFTTSALPTAHLTLIDIDGEHAESGDYTILTPFNLPNTAAACSKEFYGWTATENYSSENDAPEYKAGDEFTFNNTTGVTLYAVYATAAPGATIYTLTSAGDLSEGTYVIAGYVTSDANDKNYKALTGSVSSGDLVNEETGFSIDANNKIVSLPEGADEFTFTAVTGGYSIQNSNDDYLGYTSTSDNRKMAFGEYSSLVWSATAHSKTDYPEDGLYLSTSAYKIFTNGSGSTVVRGYKSTADNQKPIYLFKKTTGESTYSAYATTCAALPVATADADDVAELVNVDAAGTSGTIAMTYSHVNTSNLEVDLFNDAECSEAFTGAWLSVDLDNGDIDYTIAANSSYTTARTAYIKLTAPETTGATDPAVVIIPVSQESKPKVFASLAELAAAELNSGDEVTVTINNRITNIYTNYYNYRYGIYLNVQKYNQEEPAVLKDIEIYFNSEQVPASEPEWVVGGTVSGTITCPWNYYNDGKLWQLVPGEGWHWTDLTYDAPATVTEVSVSGTPDKDTYNTGEAFAPAGLSVHVVYSDETYADITAADDDWAYITWDVTPATFAAEHIGTDKSVSVTATYSGVTSTPATVIGDLTVNKVAVTGVTLNQNAATLKVGKTVTLTATVEPANATYKGIEWSTSDGSVATVENGVVTAVAAGTATITVTATNDNTKTATCTITVTDGINFAAGDWTLVKDAAELTEGSYVIIAAKNFDFAMKSYESGNNCGSEAATKNGDMLEYDEDFGIFEIGDYVISAVTYKTFQDAETDQYLYISTNNNRLQAQDTKNENAAWTITSVSNTGVAVVTSKSQSSRTIRYNDNSDLFACYTSAQADIALYKYYAPVPKVTYNKNTTDDVTGMPNPAIQRAENNKATIAAGPIRYGYDFTGWNRAENGSGDAYTVGQEYTISEDITLYAQWDALPTYTVSYSANGGTGTAPAAEATAYQGETITLLENTFTNPGKAFDGWKVTYNNGTEQEIEVEDNQFTMPAYDVVIKAVWSTPSNQKWLLVTDASKLEAGKKYVIAAAGDKEYAMSTNQKSNNRGQTAIVKNGNEMTGSNSMQIITLGGSAGAWEFNVGSGYLYAASSSSNYLRTQAENDDNGRWTISISTDGEGVTSASIVANGTNTRNVLQYNSGDELFSCYGSASQSPVAIYREKELTKITENSSASISEGNDVEIGENVIWTVSSNQSVGDLYLKEGAVVANSAEVTAKNLYFKAKAGKSNQVYDASQLNVVNDFYYDFQLCDGSLDADYWYSIAVPFDVNLSDGVMLADGTPLNNGSDFEVWGYNTSLRAQTQSNGWQRVSNNKMEAGKAYLIGFNPGMPNTVRLKAAPGWKEHMFSGTEMSVVTTGSGTHDNWNGLANPTMRYIDVDKDAQVFNNDNHSWDSYTTDADRYNFVVGTAFFVQSSSAVAISNEDHGNYRAPKRVSENKCAYAVRITREDATDFDNQIIVRASEEATGEYTQGHDMLTMNGTTAPSAMLWTENYGGKRLAIEEAAWLNGTASYVLKVYAPAAGAYSISVASAKENADLYLTYEGAIIWNLSMGEYTIDLNKGTTKGYGLLLVRKAPNAATGVEDSVFSDQSSAVQKVIIDEHVFILRGGQMYDVNGKMVK